MSVTFRLAFLMSAASLISLGATVKHALSAEELEFRDVFVSGEGDYRVIRTPQILATKNGTLLVFAQGRDGLHDQGDNDIILKRVTLFAIISATEITYFTPNEEPEAMRKAESGRYEIYKTTPVIDMLEEVYSLESDTKHVRRDFSPHELSLRWVTSPDGEQGWVGLGSSPAYIDYFFNHNLKPEEPPDQLKIPFTRILVKDNPTNKKISEYEINTPEFAAVLDVWEKYWANGKPGITKDALILELKGQGFSTPSAKAIDRVCRPEHARKGRRAKTK